MNTFSHFIIFSQTADIVTLNITFAQCVKKTQLLCWIHNEFNTFIVGNEWILSPCLFFPWNMLILIYIIYISCILFFLLCRSLSYWTRREGGKNYGPLLSFQTSAACSHILLDKTIKHPAYNLINLFYVGEYCNPVGCSLFYTHITEHYFFSMAHLLNASVKHMPRLETRCATEQDPNITQRLLISQA